MVEWKKLGEIAKRNKGIPITAGKMSELASKDGDVRVFAAGSTIADIDESKLPEGRAYKLPSIIVKSRGYIDFEFYEKPFTHKNEMWSYSFENKQEGKFIYYFLTTKTVFFRKKAKANSVKLPQLCVADIDDYLIPIPPLSEEQRIVGILDTFTASIDNLKEQIAQRRKQYEYYRDQLLDLEGKPGVEMKKLGEILLLNKGEYITKKEANDGIYPVILGGKEPAYYIDRYNHTGKAIVISRSGASAGYVSFWDEPIFVTDGFLIEPKENVAFEYLYYVLKSKQRELQNTKKGGAIPHITPSLIVSLGTFLPNMSTQSRIVGILDTFETSIQNLEAQLKEREKQYEYYRNKLLTFE